jgi:hypothetical protein
MRLSGREGLGQWLRRRSLQALAQKCHSASAPCRSPETMRLVFETFRQREVTSCLVVTRCHYLPRARAGVCIFVATIDEGGAQHAQAGRRKPLCTFPCDR